MYDSTCPFDLNPNAFVAMEEKLPWAYKAIELYDRGAIEDELRHGIQQLRYAAPVLFRKELDYSASSHPDDRAAIFLSKILVTNAPLRVLRAGVGIAEIKKATKVEEISDLVDTAILYSDYGPDFEAHVRSVYSEGAVGRMDLMKSVRSQLSAQGRVFKYSDDPVEFLEGLVDASRGPCHGLAAQFFITTLKGLPGLLRKLKRQCIKAYNGRKISKPKPIKIKSSRVT